MNNVPTSVSLPSLKILHLKGIRFVDDDSINRFLFGCPVLEELSMIECVGENVSVINIVAPMLTSLFMLDSSFAYRRPPHGFERKIVLDTPALLNLKIKDSAQGFCYLVENLHHLIRADIFLYAGEASAISKALGDLLKGMSNVQFLTFGSSLETYMRDWQLPKFSIPNMTCLELGEIYDLQWKFLMEFLENSPRLETLVFKEVIGISYFRGKKKEWKIVNYFLQNAKVLEKVNID